MDFTVPQFIDKEAKIVGPLTFKQFIIVLVPAGFCLFLYFVLPFSVFIAATIFFVGLGLALAFLKINGATLPVFIKNAMLYLFGSKVYLWKKKDILPKLMPEQSLREEIEETVLKVGEKSHLSQLFKKIESKK